MQKRSEFSNKVLIVGGGMGGIRAALDLAEAGRDVVLVDKSYSIGGLMTSLDRTFPTNNCDLCTLSPRLSESGRQLHIELMTMTEVESLEGGVGNFKANVTTRPRYIDLQKCTACGECYRQFPGCVRFTPGLDHRAPTCMRYPQATPYAFSIDMDACPNIEELVRICPAGAILPDDQPRKHEVDAGAIIMAPGAEITDPKVLDTYGYGVYPNVVTSLEYERILSASGPTGGQLVRPSDGKKPRKVAWIQCAGSRGLRPGFEPYCSSACCMYALKEAMVTRERFLEDIETTIFYMDMRTYGKDYELYLQRAKNQYGVRFERSRPHSLEPVFSDGTMTGDLALGFMPYGAPMPVTREFDMVVLSTGFRVSDDVRGLAAKMGVELNDCGFAKTGSFDPVATSKPGIYACGLFEAPKDIPETLVQAGAAACCASADLSPLRVVQDKIDNFPPERDISSDEARIGVFVCDCENNIGGVIDVKAMATDMRNLPDVVVSETIGHGCSRDSLERIQEVIRQENLNRVVIGACSPRTHEAVFQDTLRKAGLNKYLLEIVNLRDQDTWVHTDNPAFAACKAKELMHMGIGAVRLTHPLADYTLPMNKDVLVVGGGVTGMKAALSLAEGGFKVFLVERSNRLGGTARKVRKTLEGQDVQAFLEAMMAKVESQENIQVLKQAVVVDHSGIAGMFKTGVQVGPRMVYRQLTHGITILATGALVNRPEEMLLGDHDGVLTQLDLDSVLEDSPEKIKELRNVVMIQCVGSRVPENPNCSRVCCQAAVKNALRIKEINPEANIAILYRDMRTPGLQELYYTKAREKGVVFVNYEMDDKPVVAADGKLVSVTFTDPVLGRKINIPSDCLVLSTGFVADEESTEDLGVIFRLPRTSDGYFLEDHVKLRPVDLPTPGFFVAGAAHSPKNIRDSIAQAQAVASRAQTFLASDAINMGAAVARVDSNRCAACLICVRACPFDVPFINSEGHSEIDPAKCHGCGTCASECPAEAIQLMRYEDDLIFAKLDGLFERTA
ncbi:MAG: FAD-dependent oxidoreductase [Syntrophobacteraceae bacterium]|nr:FAD-dependent oxidoreductase [Syntrophobacteraceae bacterium]